MQQKAVGDAIPTYGDSGVVESADGARFLGRGYIPDAVSDYSPPLSRSPGPEPKSTGDWAASQASTT